MARNKNPESFFKVLVNEDFATKLRLPRAFVEEYGESLPEDVRLRISYARNFWNVRLEKMEGEYYFTGGGWTRFAEEMGLKILEFLVFWFGGKSTFHVSIYGITGCERGIPFGNETGVNYTTNNQSNVEENHEASRDDSPLEHDNPRVEVVLKKHHKSRVWLSKQFVVAADLIEKERVCMEYLGGHRVDGVFVVKRLIKGTFAFELAAGWPKFCHANKLVVGNTYLFEFIPDRNVIRVSPLQK